MLIEFTRPVLVGSTSHPAGARVEVEDAVAHRHVRAGSALVVVDVPPVETAEAPAAPERATDAPDRKRRT